MSFERFRRTALSAVKLVATLAVVTLVLLSVAHAVPALVGAEKSYIVTSGSMEPAIQTGDVIFVYGTDSTSLDRGDIVAFDERAGDDQIVTHRVVEVVETENGVGYVTKGDANEDADPGVVRPEQVVGTVPTPFGVPTRIPMLGQFLVFAGSRQGIVVMVFIPVGLLIGSELYTIGRAMLADPDSAGGTADPPTTEEDG